MTSILGMLKRPSDFIDNNNYSILYPILLHIIIIGFVVITVYQDIKFILFSVILFYFILLFTALYVFFTWNSNIEETSKDLKMIKKVLTLSGVMMIFSIITIIIINSLFPVENNALQTISLTIIAFILALFISLQAVTLLFDVKKSAKRILDFLSLIIMSLITALTFSLAAVVIYHFVLSGIRSAVTMGGSW